MKRHPAPIPLSRDITMDSRRHRGCAVRPQAEMLLLGSQRAANSWLYQSEQRRGRDFWIVRANGSERPWSYRTQFGRKRPLPPPAGRWHRRRLARRSSRISGRL